MQPASVKPRADAGASGFEKVMAWSPGPVTTMPPPVVFALVLPNETLPLRPSRWNWIV
mgnify:CR=1 FL=1